MTSFTRRTAILGGLAALTALSSGAAYSAPANLTGSYKAHGRNPNGSAYEGSVAIVEVNGQVNVTWTVGGQVYEGKGARQGDVLVVDWGSKHPLIYVVMPNGNLHGTWDDGKALEKLTKL